MSRYLAPSHSLLAVREAGAVAADAEHKESQKYMHLSLSCHVVPIAVEGLGLFGKDAHSFLKELTRQIKLVTDDTWCTSISFDVFQWQSREEMWLPFSGALG